MSFIPAFEIGVWNAWILMLYIPLHPLLMMLINKAVGTGGMSQKMASVPHNKTEKRTFYSSMAILLLLLIYSVFLPLKLGTIWFYIGLPIYVVGLTMFMISIVNIATTPLGEPFAKGIYSYSRHPMSFFGFLTFIGVCIASASWVFLLFSIVYTILSFVITIPEERFCLEKYGDVYRQYMNRTPRWIGLPKSGGKK